MNIYAWVGEDELGSGKMGIKRGVREDGSPVVLAIMDEGLKAIQDPAYIQGLQVQANIYGKTIRLVRFMYAEDIIVIKPE